MSKPGAGRYTSYVGNDPAKIARLRKLFNDTATSGGDFYGNSTKPEDVAALVLNNATANVGFSLIPKAGKQPGDGNMFPGGVDLRFGQAPNTNDVTWESASKDSKTGGPSNPFVPDVLSPGASGGDDVNLSPRNADPKLSITDFKPNYVKTANTAGPSETSPKIATLGDALTAGTSQKAKAEGN